MKTGYKKRKSTLTHSIVEKYLSATVEKAAKHYDVTIKSDSIDFIFPYWLL